MKLNLAILFCVIALIAAVPVWADGIPHSTIVADSFGGTSGTKLNAPGLLVESGSLGAKPSIAPDTFFPSSSEMDVHHAGLSSLDSHDRTSFVSRTGGKWWVAEDHSRDWVEAEEHRNHKRDDKGEPSPDPVPEPGALSLLLSGLLSLGFLAHRRAAGII
jgi:PEP-CTERM motif-containing protein